MGITESRSTARKTGTPIPSVVANVVIIGTKILNSSFEPNENIFVLLTDHLVSWPSPSYLAKS